MPDFESWVKRHGESFIQALLEQMEKRGRNADADAPLPLEERWVRALDAASPSKDPRDP